MKLKKIVASLLASVMVFSFAACTRSGEEDSSSSSSSSSSSISSSSSSSSSSTGLDDKEEDDSSLPELEVVDNKAKVTEAKGVNAQVTAYLEVPNTTIGEPVVQPSSKDDYNNYLRYTWDKAKWAEDGCYFVDYRDNLTSRKDMTKNVTIYGHNISLEDDENRDKFSQLLKYRDEDFAKENPYFYISTEDEDMVFQIFTVFYANSNLFHYNTSDFADDAAFGRLIQEARDRSEWDYEDVKVTKDDKIVTLSTCTYKFSQDKSNPYRFVVMGKLMKEEPKGEKTANIKKNADVMSPDDKFAA